MKKTRIIAWLDEQFEEQMNLGEKLNKEGSVHSADCANSQARAFQIVKNYIKAYGKEEVKNVNVTASFPVKFKDGNYGFIYCDQDGNISLSDTFIDAIEEALEERHQKSSTMLDDDLGTVYEVMEKISNIDGFIQDFRDNNYKETPYEVLRRIQNEINRK